MSDNFHNYDTGAKPVLGQYHAYVKMKDLNDGMKYASRLAVDRARAAGENPRNGDVSIYFDDDGVGAKWTASE